MGAGEQGGTGAFTSAPQHLCTSAHMASPAFIKYRHEEELLAAAGDDPEHAYLTRILPDKLRLDLEYIAQQSFMFDLGVLARAALSLFSSPERQ